LRVIEEASQVDNGDILFKSLKSENGVQIMETLVKVGNTVFKERALLIVCVYVASD
jgi:hypothetical protein